MSSQFATAIQYKGKTYGITFDPSKYCFHEIVINIKEELENKRACEILKLNRDFYNFLITIYGECKNSEFWGKLYEAIF